MSVMSESTMQRVDAAAGQVRIGRALATLLVGVFWCVGWIARKTVLVASVALRYAAGGVRVGWEDAAPHRPSEAAGGGTWR